MSAFIPTTLPLRTTPPPLSTKPHTPRCALDTDAPPESRYAKNYPSPRFEAPFISLFNAPDFPLVNKIGLVREPVPLDLAQAAELLAQARASYAHTSGDFTAMFVGPTTNPTSIHPSDKYYPSFRRDECPIIEITPASDQSSPQVTISLGSVSATPPPEEHQVQLSDVPLGSPWNQRQRLSPSQIIDMYFANRYRNLAPVIEFPPGQLAIAMEMKPISGECEAEFYSKDTRFMAPKIDIKKPSGEWDSSAYINLEMEEIQLPLVGAALLKDRQ